LNVSFGVTRKRFDVSFDNKEYFNRDPAPGSYSVSTAETSMIFGGS
jgi:hypothetical protein